MKEKFLDLLLLVNEIQNDPATPDKYKRELTKHEYFLKSVIEKGENPKSNKNKGLLLQLLSFIFDYYNSD
ncbi:hypothetical protein [Carboxylicivirga marina]|uniref:hypothetical protein n=1 Tax=Carboxylicivirga marina TaxID=2800988 RepID=UPI0025985E96|nr:hypothetical protein [uncultured Carboxylicivirga sp.]